MLASFDVAYHYGKKRYNGIFLTTLTSMLLSSMVSSFIGTQFAMNAVPFYEARKFIPTFGMLLGNSMSGLAIGINSVLDRLSVQGDHIEAYLAMGASRFEAGEPLFTILSLSSFCCAHACGDVMNRAPCGSGGLACGDAADPECHVGHGADLDSRDAHRTDPCWRRSPGRSSLPADHDVPHCRFHVHGGCDCGGRHSSLPH